MLAAMAGPVKAPPANPLEQQYDCFERATANRAITVSITSSQAFGVDDARRSLKQPGGGVLCSERQQVSR